MELLTKHYLEGKINLQQYMLFKLEKQQPWQNKNFFRMEPEQVSYCWETVQAPFWKYFQKSARGKADLNSGLGLQSNRCHNYRSCKNRQCMWGICKTLSRCNTPTLIQIRSAATPCNIYCTLISILTRHYFEITLHNQ